MDLKSVKTQQKVFRKIIYQLITYSDISGNKHVLIYKFEVFNIASQSSGVIISPRTCPFNFVIITLKARQNI